ncbi:EAL domain-containing protein [Mariprofundus ferrooxydans]|uniref:EAL domain-containing protein n=1 Tax=Mariprofundus ferrooxydans TaxID=314344 RepID=UPI00037268DF|nr:EAL domain-containing protein [Mariprofundus ferrooxydans]
MAHKLNVRSVAEGVETQKEWDQLKSAGCDVAQGFLIGKPMDITSFLDFAEEYSKKH